MTDPTCTGLFLDVLQIDEKQVKLLEVGGLNSIDAIVEFFEESIGCGAILPLSHNDMQLTAIDFHAILSRLKTLGCWPDVTKLDDLPLDQFHVSEDCRRSLLQSGFSSLHEMVWTFEQMCIGGTTGQARWLKHHEEIFTALRRIGAWGICRSVSG